MDAETQWKFIEDCPYQLKTPRGKIRHTARQWFISLVQREPWITSRMLIDRFGLSKNSARSIVYTATVLRCKKPTMPALRFGFRDDTYFTELDLLSCPYYNPKELKEEEKAIYTGRLVKFSQQELRTYLL